MNQTQIVLIALECDYVDSERSNTYTSESPMISWMLRKTIRMSFVLRTILNLIKNAHRIAIFMIKSERQRVLLTRTYCLNSVTSASDFSKDREGKILRAVWRENAEPRDFPWLTIGLGILSLGTLIAAGYVGYQLIDPIASGLNLAAVGGAATASTTRKKGDTTMKNSITSKDLIQWIKDVCLALDRIELPENTFTLAVKNFRIKRGRVSITDATIPSPENGEPLPLKVEKSCLMGHMDIDPEDIGLELYHASTPILDKDGKWDRTSTRARDRGLLALWRTGLVFGSGLKGELKWNTNTHRVKFYMVKAKGLISKVFSGAASLMAYGTLLLSDTMCAVKCRVLVLTPEERDARLKTVFGPTAPKAGSDGSSYIRQRVLDKVSDTRFNGKPLGALQFRAGRNLDNGSLAIGKGVLDSKKVSDSYFDKLFGTEYDAVLIRGDQIKVNRKQAISGTWTIAFTYLRDRTYSLPSMWETTAFLEDNAEVRRVFVNNMRAEIDAISSLLVDRHGLIALTRVEIARKIEKGDEDVTVDTKLLLSLCSNIPSRFTWNMNQISKLILGNTHRVIKSQGTSAKGQLALIDNYKSKYTRRYIDSAIAEALGADDDGDIIGVYWCNTTGKAAYFRYPCISGICVVDIPKRLRNRYPDHHPEMVSLYDKYGINLNISRNQLQGNLITLPLRRIGELALKIMGGLNIGQATVTQFDCLTLGKKDLATTAGLSMESSTLSIKKDVEIVSCPRLSKEDKDKSNRDFMKFTRKVPTSWESLVETDAFKEDSKEAFFINKGIELATDLYKQHLQKDLVHVSALRSCVNWTLDDPVGGVAVTERSIEVYDTYLSNITPWVKAKEDGKIDDEEFDAAVKPILGAVESYGETLSLLELKALVDYVGEKAGPMNTGAFVIHSCGSRILDVFGVWDGLDVDVFYEQEHEKVNKTGYFHMRVVSKSFTNIAELHSLKDTFKVTGTYTCEIGGQEFTLGAEARRVGWPLGELELRTVGRAMGSSGLRKKSAELYIRADNS